MTIIIIKIEGHENHGRALGDGSKYRRNMGGKTGVLAGMMLTNLRIKVMCSPEMISNSQENLGW